MKTIDIEKVLYLAGAIDLLPVTMKDNFVYQKENDGVRCIGPFLIKGRYTTVNEVKDFQDVFEFDVFAANEKLDGEEFRIVYDDYDFSLKDGVTLTLHFSVFGIKNEVEAHYETEDRKIQEMADIYAREEADEQIEIVDETIEDNEDKDMDLSMIEDLFEDKDNVITSYSFVVVKKDDDYDSIASRYQVEVEALRNVNSNKVIHEKSLIVLPYAK